jgi:biotin synthase
MFYGDQLLTTSNPQTQKDRQLFERLGIRASQADALGERV